MEEKPTYVEIEALSRRVLEEGFASKDENTICNAMYSAAQHEPDWRWTQGKLLEFLKHKSLLLRWTALVALGELVLFRGEIEVEVVFPVLYKLKEEDPELAPYVDDCIDEIRSRITIQ